MEFSEVVEVLDRGNSLDVQSNCTFESLMISKKTLERLKANQFDRPSPVQAKAIPIGLLGRDMLVQAKSGTGKTLVFSVLAVENLDTRASYIQKVIVTPTREIAVQIKETVRKVAPIGARTSAYVGGIPHKLHVTDLQTTRPQIVIGTTGRICQLIKLKAMDISRVDFFVLDEADKLMDDIFKDDINFLINSLPPLRQVAVFSATYPRNLDVLLSTFLRDAALVRFNADDVQLIGIKQYVVTECSPMLEKLTKILKSVRYVQALVFCDQITKCEPTATYLKSQGLDVTFVSSAMTQKERQLAVDLLRSKKVKILVSSDLTARGIDADHVNMVVNIDAAANEETYFHRIGRAARFGAQGAAITLLEDEKAVKCFTALAYRGKVTAKRANLEDLPEDLPKNTEFYQSLPNFIDFDKSAIKSKSNDLDKVPDRKTAAEALRVERETAGIPNDLKYSRDTMVTLREGPSQSSEPEKQVEGEEKENQNGSGEATKPSEETEEEEKPVVKKSFKERLAELKAAKKNQKPEEKKEIVPVKEEKPKFKFVPTREKAKKKYYMRGELLHIRNSFTAEQWRAYAESKHDLSQPPFLGNNGNQEQKTIPVPSTSATSQYSQSSVKSQKKAKKAQKPKNPNLQTYSRKEMISIQTAVPKKAWIPYIKSKWDTTEEPWEFDFRCRISAEERFRRERRREKEERKKVMEERKKKREEERRELVSSGRTTQLIQVRGDSWADYQQRILKDFEEKTALRKKRAEEGAEPEKRNFGPVVPARDPPHIYKYRVDMYKRRLDEQDAYIARQIELETKKVAEIEIQTEELTKTVKEDVALQTDDVKIQEEEEEEDVEDEEYWNEDEEYWNEDEEEWYDEEEEEEKKEDVPSSSAPPVNVNHEAFAQLGAGYVRNINFQAAAQSYMDLMNSAMAKFSK